MDRRGFFELALAALFPWPKIEPLRVPAIIDHGHTHAMFLCRVCHGACTGHHHVISDPGHQHTWLG